MCEISAWGDERDSSKHYFLIKCVNVLVEERFTNNKIYKIMNSVITLHIRYKGSCWVFDDDRFGLVDEPFVTSTNTIIDEGIEKAGIDLNTARVDGVLLYFSFEQPPTAMQATACTKIQQEGDWTEYKSDTGTTGWLCPALFHYTEASRPEHIYFWCEKV